MRGFFARFHGHSFGHPHGHHGGHPHHRHHGFAHAMWHAHAGRHGLGQGGGRHGGHGRDDMEGFGAGRKLRSADLQLLILALLAERPRHGYELIKDIEAQSKGYYVPSPGMIYPALSYLEEAGHAQVDMDGTKKRYSLTNDGGAYLAEHRAAADALIAQLARMGERTERARQAWSGEATQDDGEGGFFARFHARRKLTRELHDAYHVIKDALRPKIGASAAEQRRVAEILMRAAAEIAAQDEKDNG